MQQAAYGYLHFIPILYKETNSDQIKKLLILIIVEFGDRHKNIEDPNLVKLVTGIAKQMCLDTKLTESSLASENAFNIYTYMAMRNENPLVIFSFLIDMMQANLSALILNYLVKTKPDALDSRVTKIVDILSSICKCEYKDYLIQIVKVGCQ